MKRTHIVLLLVGILFFSSDNFIANVAATELGVNEALRTYVEFADGTNRGIYDPVTDSKGFPDEDYDATTAMVINWHRLPEEDAKFDARLIFRQVYPSESEWQVATGESFEFWYRPELINRVILTDLTPGSVYEYMVADNMEVFRFRTMPANLEERDVRLAMTADHQQPSWNEQAHLIAQGIAAEKPDMFVAVGDYVNCEGAVTEQNAERWANYLDILYGVGSGYFIIDDIIDGQAFDNIVIPHVAVLGNHETGEQHHIRWPACVATGSAEPGYPQYRSANWMQQLFHWPFSSEGFYSEFNPNHPNMNPDTIIEGYGMGGYGKLSFGDYLLLIGLDNSQNFEGKPDQGLRDWEGNLITDKWPWYETLQADIRQDEWLLNLLEPADGPDAGEVYTHIIPVWHRGLFSSARLNMSLKNRAILKYWLPGLHRQGVKFFYEAHDHLYTRTVPLGVTTEQPSNTYLEKVYYEPRSWPLTDNLTQEYIDDYYAVNSLFSYETGEIVGWEYDGFYVTHDPQGMIAHGNGGWAAGRRQVGDRGAGNAGFWFIDNEHGGTAFSGDDSFHFSIITLSNDALEFESLNPIVNRALHKSRWDIQKEQWFSYDYTTDRWVDYGAFYSEQ